MRRLLSYSVLLIFILSACSSEDSALSKFPRPAVPEKGKATAYGQIVDIKTGEPLGSVVVRLAEVHREGEGGVFLLDFANSPGDRTDESGIFVIENFPSGEYVMAIGDGDNINLYDVIEDGDTGKAKVWTVLEDQISEFGVNRAEVLFR